jgi:glycosyltransferase involved in cell wall biosynthesis
MDSVSVGLDATYSVGRNLSGVGAYSRKLLFGLTAAHPEEKFYFHYRSHRVLRSLRDSLPSNAHRRLLSGVPSGDLFHALNQRVDVRARRTITTVHDLFVLTNEYSTAEFRARFAKQAREAAERSDRVIAVSEFTAKQVEELLGVEKSRLSVIPHGVDLPAEVRVRRDKVILFTGAIQRRKNVARLVRAYERVPKEWKLVLAGAVDGYGAEEELATIEASPRRRNIQVLGYVSRSELDQLYARAAIFALPSLDEGFGIPILEAMANGAAVVTSNRSAMPEVAGDATLLVDPLSEEEIGEALLRLVSDDTLRQQMAARGRQRAATFSWGRAVRDTWSVYEEVW